MDQNQNSEPHVLIIHNGAPALLPLTEIHSSTTKSHLCEGMLRRGLRVKNTYINGTIELEGNISDPASPLQGDMWIFLFDYRPKSLAFEYDPHGNVEEVTYGPR